MFNPRETQPIAHTVILKLQQKRREKLIAEGLIDKIERTSGRPTKIEELLTMRELMKQKINRG